MGMRQDRGRAAPSAGRTGSSWDNPIAIADDESTTPRRRRALATAGSRFSAPSSSSAPITAHPPAPQTPPSTSRPRKRKAAAAAADRPEKRLRRHRAQPPQAFDQVFARALSQRFFVLGRRRSGSDECPSETFALAGSTGNVYTVRVDRTPSCDCPHAVKGNQCKHVLYILARVLHAPFELVYQLALLASELRAILPAPGAGCPDAATTCSSSSGDDGKGKRKPVEGDCPICFCELDATGAESVVWCRAACGQNMHQQCFDTWAKTKAKGGARGRVPCPMCRSDWVRADGSGLPSLDVRLDQAVDSEGYANVAGQLGISGVRDVSSYSDWYRRQGGRRRERW